MAIDAWVIHCDGTALPQRGRMSIGVHATNAVEGDGDPGDAREVHTISRALGNGDNNEAEALALVAALELAQSLGARNVEVRTDSDVVVAHVTARRRVVAAHIAAPLDRAIALMHTFESARVVLVPRHRNTEADALARAALGLQRA